LCPEIENAVKLVEGPNFAVETTYQCNYGYVNNMTKLRTFSTQCQERVEANKVYVDYGTIGQCIGKLLLEVYNHNEVTYFKFVSTAKYIKQGSA